jgi:hypothetical protein
MDHYPESTNNKNPFTNPIQITTYNLPLKSITNGSMHIFERGRECSYHIETKEAVTEEHLDLLVMSGKIAMRIASGVLVHASPLIPRWCQLVRS